MKVAVVVYPGTTCDRDTYVVFKEVLGWEVEYVFHTEKDVSKFDLVVLPGGFSFGDYLRVGAVARFSPISEALYKHSERGKPLLGICNGFQILVEMGLLPGALMQNKNGRFICKFVQIRVESSDSLLTAGLEKGSVLRIPIAHMDGNYYIDRGGLEELEKNGQVVFRYCTEDGEVLPDANPNGSVSNIAGICNKNGNVLGLMPHPERAALNFHLSKDGILLLQSVERFYRGA